MLVPWQRQEIGVFRIEYDVDFRWLVIRGLCLEDIFDVGLRIARNDWEPRTLDLIALGSSVFFSVLQCSLVSSLVARRTIAP